ncbi:MAG: AsmA family protein, partial [Gammaproteobacteria bacterium]|nr:AsmA family protein [Gammaproteobacteria bacterium]
VTNWDDMAARFISDEQTDEEVAASITGSIAGLSVKNSSLHWQDAKDSQNLDVTVKRFETGELKPGTPTRVDGDIAFSLENPQVQGQVQVKGITRLSQFDPFILSEPELTLALQGEAVQAENIQATVDTSEIRYAEGIISLQQPDIDYQIQNMPSLGKQAKGKLVATSLRVADGDIRIPGANINIDLSGSALPGETLQATLKSEQLNLLDRVLTMQGYNINTTATGEPWPNKNFAGVFSGKNATLDLNTETLSAPDLNAGVYDLDISGSVQGRQLLQDDPVLQGKLSLQEFSPKTLAPKLGIELPKMSADAWSSMTLDGNYRVSKNSLAMQGMRAVIDGTAWQGKAAIDDLAQKKLSFDLTAASLDANRLLPPKQADALKDKDGNSSSQATVAAISIPQDPLRDWDVSGTAKIGRMLIGNIETTNLEAGIKLLDGKLRIFPSKANFFGGQYSGDIRLDVSGPSPKLQANETITNIDLKALGDAMWANAVMTGTTSGRIELSTFGDTVGAMQQNALGDANFTIKNGVFEGFDINYAVANALSLLKNRAVTDVADTKKTPFETLQASTKLSNGVLQNDDFLAVMPRMRIRGKGNLNTLDQSINYQVSADVLERKASNLNNEVQLSLDELVGATIPVKITGTLQAPKVRPDVSAFLRAKAEQELRDKAREKLDDKLKDKVGGALGSLLGDVLGGKNPLPEKTPSQTPDKTASDPANPDTTKPASDDPASEPDPAVAEEPEIDPLEQKKDELEQKAKDKLKDLFGG